MEIWIGKGYAESTHRTLILGESAYGESDLKPWIEKWINGSVKDRTFARVFNAISSTHTSKACADQRLEFWNSIAFYNFVIKRLGTVKCRPTKAQYEDSKAPLQTVLEEHQPKGIWVLGREQAKYSEPVIQSLNFPVEVSRHPASRGLRNESLKESWVKLQEKLNDA